MVQGFDPSPIHPPDLIKTPDGMVELRKADPAPAMDDAPENTQLFQQEIQGSEVSQSGRGRCVDGLDAALQRLQHQAI